MTKKTEVATAEAVDFDLDLSSLDVTKFANEGTEIAIKHPVTGKPIGFYISILGKDGDVYKEIVRERSNETVKKAIAAEATGETMQPPTYDEQQERELELLAALTTGWRQENGKKTVKLAGEEYEFNANNAKMIYRRFDFIRQQVDKSIADISLFMKG
jgi:hypothetical protein